MFRLFRWSSPSAASDAGPRRESLVSDGKCDAASLSPTASSAATSTIHLPEAETKKTGKNLNDFPRSRPLSTVRVLVAHIGWTIVSTCLPTIIEEFDGSQSDYTWIGVAYLLTQTACQPLYGRLSDLTGRKYVLFSSILIFALGSLLCGAARDLKWLIAARALSGIGGGGIVSSVWVITSELVDVSKRAKWSQALSVTWSCSAIAGPLLGGIFSTESSSVLSWRWAFYLTLPISFLGALVLALSLNGIELEGPKGASWKDFLRRFDFVGLTWTATSTLTLVVVGIGLLISAGVHEVQTTRDALFPQAIFKNFNISTSTIPSLCSAFSDETPSYYPCCQFPSQRRTVNLSFSNFHAAVMLLPYSLGSSLASMPVAWLLGAIQRRAHSTVGQKRVISAGLFIATTGFALLWLLDTNTPILMQSFLPLLAGFGIGMLFHAPYQALTNVLSPKELAAGTGAFFLVRFTGATVGLSIAGAIFQNNISRNFPYGASLAPYTVSRGSEQIPLAIAVQAFRDVWTMCAPCLGGALLLSFFLRPTPLPASTPSTGADISKSDAEK
ncbi:major facilitator superfamily domain-containing protein [Russula compacta]|nr:major facilitator superfamily domain-containing protein [Russula compacta]